MPNRKKEEKRNQNGQVAATEKDNALVMSSRLMADLKNKGIAAFRQLTDKEQKLVWRWSKEVIGEYRNVLEADPSNIRSIEDLPFAKDDIKLAIKLSLPLYISKDMQGMIRMLKTAYKEIGAFQSVDPEVVERRTSVAASRGEVASQGKDQNDLVVDDSFMQLVVSEKKALLQEINDFIIQLETVV